MNRQLHVLLFILTFLIKSGEVHAFKFSNITNGTSNQYGINGTLVCKLDSLGNSIWAKDFAGYIMPSTFSNELYGSAFDGKYLYVIEMQGQLGSGIPPTFYPSIIKMDTLGNVLFIKSTSINSAGGYGFYQIFPSPTNGVWIIDNGSSGITNMGAAFPMDSSGNVGARIGFWHGSVSTSKTLRQFSDLTFVISVDHRQSQGGIDVPFTTLTRFRENGTIIWSFDYEISGGIIGDFLGEQQMIVDSLDNVYIICNLYQGTTNATVGIKVGSNGNVLLAKLWPDLLAYSITDLKFKNNQLIAVYNGEEIQFDTMLNNTCLNTQNFSIDLNNTLIPTTTQHTYNFENFTPLNSTFNFTNPVYQDYCLSASTNSLLSDDFNFSIYPNPASGIINISNSKNASYTLVVSDLQGKIYIEEVSENAKHIDVTKLMTGMYFVTLINASTSITKKIIIN